MKLFYIPPNRLCFPMSNLRFSENCWELWLFREPLTLSIFYILAMMAKVYSLLLMFLVVDFIYQLYRDTIYGNHVPIFGTRFDQFWQTSTSEEPSPRSRDKTFRHPRELCPLQSFFSPSHVAAHPQTPTGLTSITTGQLCCLRTRYTRGRPRTYALASGLRDSAS